MFLARRLRLWGFAAERGDLILAILLAVPVLGSLAWHAGHYDQPLVLLLGLPAMGSLFLRRSRPAAALLIAVAVRAALPSNDALGLPVMAVLYTIATQTEWRVAAAAAAGAAGVAIIADGTWGSGGLSDHGGLLGYAIGATASFAAAVALGLYLAARGRVLDGLRERAERLDREKELLAERAVSQERTRIAQELHDIVAHNVTLMVVEAQALGAIVPDQRVTQRTDAIAELGRQAMTEMHATLRLLRGEEEAPELTPQPGLAQLERLIEQLRRAGLQIELTIAGQPRPLAQGVDLSAYRIIQEALTNVVKHAAGASTEVTLVYQRDGLELTIVDTEGEIRTTVLQEPSAGHGVIGMRERAALFGGRLTAESLPDGFRVTATLPYAPTVS
ncbi:MAG: sensor histidine kinase [Solirubrobacteraceae bacterium]